jgi:hypothetical protein
VFVSHDRYFTRTATTRFLEIRKGNWFRSRAATPSSRRRVRVARHEPVNQKTCFSRLGNPVELVAVRLGGRVVEFRFNPPIGQADATALLSHDFGSVDSRGATAPT